MFPRFYPVDHLDHFDHFFLHIFDYNFDRFFLIEKFSSENIDFLRLKHFFFKKITVSILIYTTKFTLYLHSSSNFFKSSMFSFGPKNCSKQGILNPLSSPKLVLFPVTFTLQAHNISDFRK